MSDSNLRFDPYTGDPIPNDAPNQPDTNATNFTPDAAGMQPDSFSEVPTVEEISASNIPEGNVDPTQMGQAPSEQPYVQPQMEQPYTANSGDNLYQSAPADQQYNPYTGQPMNNGNGPVNEAEKKDHNANIFGGVALACGIAAILLSFASFCCCPFLSIILGIAGVIFGVLAKNSLGVRSSVATGGIITSIIGIVLTIVLCLITLVLYKSGSSFLNKALDEYRYSIEDYEYNTPDYDFNYQNYDNDMYDSDNFYN